MLSTKSVLKVKAFKSSLVPSYQSFNDTIISWVVNDCGGVISGFSGNITSPDYPNAFSGETACAWQLNVEEGQVIKVWFDTFELGSNCDETYVSINNGKSSSSPLILSNCGKIIPFNLTSQDNSLWIQFVSRNTSSLSKFRLFYEMVQIGCGGIFHENTGSLTSQNFPSAYQNNIECEWQIWSSPGYHFSLNFANRFQIEESTDCTNDFVEIFEFIDDDWQKLAGRFCGRNLPPAVESKSHKVKVLFRTNEKTVGDGFKLEWSTKCGELVLIKPEDTEGYITSPGYPQNYRGPLKCNYTLYAPSRVIEGKFESFQLEEAVSGSCVYDKLEIKVKDPGRQIQLRDEYCGDMTPPPLVSSEVISILLTTDSTKHYSGFSFKYQFNVCGGNVSEPTLIQPSSSSQGLFYPRSECVWNITAPKGKVIKIKFESIEIFINRNCKWSSIQVFDSIPEAADNHTLMAQICGYHNNNPPTFRTTSNVATIKFIPGRSTRSTTFSALIFFVFGSESGCGGEINLTPKDTKIISFPRITDELLRESYLDCHWTVITSPLHVISYKVRLLNLSSNCSSNGTQCNCNYVEVHNGLSVGDNLLGRYCGQSATPGVELTSSGSFLSVTGVMNKVSLNQNFEIEVSTVTSICGEPILNLTDSVQELTSPGYPNNYPSNINCEWTIMAQYKELNIHIIDLDLQESLTCSADRLEISGLHNSGPHLLGSARDLFVNNNTSKVIQGDPMKVPEGSTIFQGHLEQGKAVFCGHVQGFNYYSRSNVLLKFISDSSGSSKGFKLSYSIAECDRNYTTLSGRISKTFSQKPCIIIIDVSSTAPANTTLSLYFSELLVQFSPGCSKGKLEVFDGGDDKGTKLLSTCGYGSKPPVFTTGPKAMIKFISGGSTSAHMDITYTSTDKGQGCGGYIYNQAGYFTSPFFPGNYRNDSICRWDISVPVGNVPELMFTEFQLGRRITCENNFVEIYDVEEETGIEIVKASFCGEDKPRKIEGTGRRIVVKYQTNIHNDGIGWAARFMAKKIQTRRDFEINHPVDQSSRTLIIGL